jgi:Uma2 family endonuclease
VSHLIGHAERKDAMVTTTRRTVEDLLAMPEDGTRYELIDGELRPMAPSSEDHSAIGALFVGYLVAHVVPNRLGRVFQADLGVQLFSGVERVLSPDASFVRRERLAKGRDRRRLVQIPPDLVVEVVSPTDRKQAVGDKVALYLALGVRMVVIVWPDSRSLDVHEADGTRSTLGMSDVFDAGDVVPGFTMRVANLFIDIDADDE